MNKRQLNNQLRLSLNTIGLATYKEVVPEELDILYKHLIDDYLDGDIPIEVLSYGVEVSLRIADLGYILDNTKYGEALTDSLLEVWHAGISPKSEKIKRRELENLR